MITSTPSQTRLVRRSSWSVLVLASLVLACGRSPIDPASEGPTVDPYIYALGLCSLKCWRLDECGLATAPMTTCEQTCIDDAVETVSDDPCWAEWIELRRCHVLEATCEGVADEDLPAGSEDVCIERERWLEDCEP